MKPTILYKPITIIHQALLNNTDNIYILIDINAKPKLRGELFNLTDAPKFRSLFHGTVLQELRDQSPFLVQIELNQYNYLEYLFDNAPENFMILFSEHSLETLYQHWQSILTVQTVKNTAIEDTVAIFRFYTAHILGSYIKACNPMEQARLLAFCDDLYLYNELHEWSRIYHSPNKTSPLRIPISELKIAHPELITAWWHLKEEHFKYLQSIN